MDNIKVKKFQNVELAISAKQLGSWTIRLLLPPDYRLAIARLLACLR
ncbi:hypothetical protein [Limnofasciculus baicalensis]|uniref:Uncharacterized protein n=1 Tax=Limnofasciculus baicalensis BBK-W-15 TaxID=2699891 RepID=A0AAE3KNJ2_9CYAN|nr:hypothetical protein [Limnofasciculus baicalensis]MCP2730409.1 hypothetical protein [Limnofasciculus baicalensis BBK-W-15]